MMLVTNNIEFEVRAATLADVPLLMRFIRAMANFENLAVSATEQSLEDALFGDAPAAHALLICVDGKPVGYATYFFTFASMTGKRGLWLDDLFIETAYRHKGIGRVLMAYLADLALQNKCGRFEWMVADWNEPAIRFYRSLGATLFTSWPLCRLGEEQLSQVAAKLELGKRDD
jgi:GNAT superfamily N-acetyltransferase